jgi:hypothetical protein
MISLACRRFSSRRELDDSSTRARSSNTYVGSPGELGRFDCGLIIISNEMIGAYHFAGSIEEEDAIDARH